MNSHFGSKNFLNEHRSSDEEEADNRFNSNNNYDSNKFSEEKYTFTSAIHQQYGFK